MSMITLITAQSTAFWLLFILFLAESVVAVLWHVMICSVPLANTILLLVSLAHHTNEKTTPATPLFQRICGSVAFCAILFVNCSHSLEKLTVKIIDIPIDDHDEHDHTHGHPFGIFWSSEIPAPVVPIIIADILLKTVLLAMNKLPSFFLQRPLQAILHFTVPVSILIMYGIGYQREITDNWLLEQLDPIVTLSVCIISVILIIPSFTQTKPYVFADTPQCFDTESFTSDIHVQFYGVVCSHIHVYRIWPSDSFEALIHINIEVNKNDDDWSETVAGRYEEISKYVRSALKKGGAVKVVIEPRFIDRTMDSLEWQGCVEPKCYVEDRGCCSAVYSSHRSEGHGHSHDGGAGHGHSHDV